MDKDCVAMYNLNNGEPGKWNDVDCEGKKAVLCKSPGDPKISNEPELEMCEGKEGFMKFNDGCYKWVEEEKTWLEAETDCTQQGGHLVSIWDGLEQAYVFTSVKRAESWIGLNKKQVRGGYIQILHAIIFF